MIVAVLCPLGNPGIVRQTHHNASKSRFQHATEAGEEDKVRASQPADFDVFAFDCDFGCQSYLFGSQSTFFQRRI